MNHELTIVQSVIIFHNKKILMGLRSSTEDVFPNLWGIPGGKVDTTNETLEDALQREVREEFGIEITNIRPIRNNINETKRKVYITYVADWLSGEPTADNDEIIEYKFLDIETISELNDKGMVTPFTFEIINAF